MATMTTDSTGSQLNEAISSLNLRSPKRIDLKKEQDLAIKSLLKEKDVLAVLLTGFGFIEWLCSRNLSPQEYKPVLWD